MGFNSGFKGLNVAFERLKQQHGGRELWKVHVFRMGYSGEHGTEVPSGTGNLSS